MDKLLNLQKNGEISNQQKAQNVSTDNILLINTKPGN